MSKINVMLWRRQLMYLANGLLSARKRVSLCAAAAGWLSYASKIRESSVSVAALSAGGKARNSAKRRAWRLAASRSFAMWHQPAHQRISAGAGAGGQRASAKA